MTQKAKTVVVISEQSDAHLPFVQAHMDHELLVLDPAAIPHGTELSFSYEDTATGIVYDGKPLHDVGAVWYRKPDSFGPHNVPVPEYYSDYAKSSLTRHFVMLRAEFEDALWVSDYYAIVRAENKMLQYRAASAVGFQIPATLLTSNKAAAEKFISQQDSIVVKTLAGENPPGTFFPTTLWNPAKPLKLDGLALAPAIFQAAIEPEVELRVTVIGRDVFVAGIVDKQVDGYPGLRDWRFNQNTKHTKFQPCDDLSQELQTSCLYLVRGLGLQYGAIDLIIDKRGQVWFLEINPNGQWAFIEEEAGLPLGQSMANLLVGKSNPL